jgi:hypothetical protein
LALSNILQGEEKDHGKMRFFYALQIVIPVDGHSPNILAILYIVVSKSLAKPDTAPTYL